MMRTCRLFLILLPVWFLFCAQRDNRFDPRSPLYVSIPPEIHLSLSCDSSRIISASNDKIYARSPFKLNLAVSSTSAESKEDDIPVSFSHYLDNNLVEQRSNISELAIVLIDSGEHVLKFGAADQYGESSSKTLSVKILPSVPPRIKSFTSNINTVNTESPAEIIFTAEVTDSHAVIEKLLYSFSPVKVVQHDISGNPGKIIRDTLVYQFSGHMQDTQSVTLYAVDILGRKDSSSIDLVFNQAFNFCKSKPPVIYHVWASACTAKVAELVDFGINADDPDGKVTGYYWWFGDYYFAGIKEPSHRFMNPGSYNVKVKISDDSGCFAYDSIQLTIISEKNSPPEIKSLEIHPDSGAAPLSVFFYAIAVDSDGTIDKYIWKFGDDGFDTWTVQPQCYYTYKKPGIYEAMLIVRDNRYAFDTITARVVVSGNFSQGPELLAFPNPAYEGQEVHFWFNSGNLNFDSKDIRYYWNIAGKTIETPHPDLRYTFHSSGNYTVKLSLKGGIEQEFEMMIMVLKE